MKETTKAHYSFFERFLYRAPLYPLNKLKEFYKFETLEEQKQVLEDPFFKEAIFLASPDLHAQLESFLNGTLSKERHLDFQMAILKYFIRICSRSTPFGLFAGVGIGKIGSESSIELSGTVHFKGVTRLDMHFIFSMLRDILKTDTVRSKSAYLTNSTLYAVGNTFRYMECVYKEDKRHHFISTIDQTQYLNNVLQAARKGAKMTDLKNELLPFEVSDEEAEEFIGKLIDNGLLMNDLEPAIIGNDILSTLITKLEGSDQMKSVLEKIQRELNLIDTGAPGTSIDQYQHIITEINTLQKGYSQKYLFQKDILMNSAEATLSQELINSISEAVSIVNKLNGNSPGKTVLDKFQDDFVNRYESQEISLLEALDSEIGIAYAISNKRNSDLNNLVDDLIFSAPRRNENISLNFAQQYILNKYQSYIQNGGGAEIEIKETELQLLTESTELLPATLYAIVSVLSTNKKSNYQVALNGCGAGAANLLGRFCHLDQEVHALAMKISATEQQSNPDVIFAEIVHLPESRVGNILLRPRFSEYEITCLANSMAEQDKVIPVSDLFVSVRNGELILRSGRLNRRIIPKLTTAQNFVQQSTPVYHFLCALQTHRLRSALKFEWGPLLKKKKFLPRIRYKNIVLSPRIWIISTYEINALPAIEQEDFYATAEVLRKKKNIPGVVYFCEGDNRLLISFDHVPSVQLLFRNRKKSIHLEEYMIDPENPFIKRGQDCFNNELILCFNKRT